MVYIGNSHRKETRALISNMNYPLGNMVGNALEVKEAMEILNGGGNKDLRDLCIVLATYMVSMAKNMDYMQAQGEVLRAIRTKEAYNKFLELVKYQGGDINNLNISNYIINVSADKDGYINDIDALKIAECSLNLGSGRKTKEDTIDHSVGIEIVKHVSEYVHANEVIAKVYVGNKEIDYNKVKSAFVIEDVQKAKEPIIYGIVK